MEATTKPTTRDPHDRLQRLLALQAILGRVSREVGPALDLQAVLTTVLDAIRSLVTFSGGTICLVERGHVYVAAADPPVSPEVAAVRLPVGQGLAGRIVATGEPVYSPDVDRDPRVLPHLRALGSNVSIKSYIGVPLVCLGQVIGLIQVDSGDEDAFDEDDLSVLEGLATQVAGAIESARRYEQISELEQLKSDFVARVSHELRTPLTIMSGFIDTLIAHGGGIAEHDRELALDRIRRANARLRYLVDELLSVTSIESGLTRPRVERIRVVDVLRQVRQDLADPDRVRIECDPTLEMDVDATILRHALIILVDNAVRYAAGCELVATDASGIAISVRDHGPGIPEHLRERVFERFVRGDHTNPGMGLGLAIVKTLAATLNARVDLTSPEDGGAEFTLRFA